MLTTSVSSFTICFSFLITNNFIIVSKPLQNNNDTNHNDHNEPHHNHPQRPPPPRPTPPATRLQQEEVETLIDESEETVPAGHPNIDLLNLDKEKMQRPDMISNIQQKKESSFDLLGSFDNSNNPMPDILGSTVKQSAEGAPVNLDDIFGSIAGPNSSLPQSKSSSDLNGLNFNAFGPSVAPSNNFSNAKSSKPAQSSFNTFDSSMKGQEKDQKPKDPFADLGNLGGSLNSNWGKPINKTTPSPIYSQYSSPSHQFGATSASTSPMAPSTPKYQMKSPNEPQRPPDYSRSHFIDPNAANANPNQKPTKTTDIFGDILGQQGYSFVSKGNQGPRTINDMRKEELVKEMDPERLKVMEWVTNILHLINFLLTIFFLIF